MSISILETQLRMTLDKLSNGEHVPVDDQWIEDAGEMFKEGLRKQLKREQENFRLRMSNIGRPACQLQMEKSGVEKQRMPYNHIIRMMMGDAIEAIMEVLLRMSGANITGGKDKASLSIAGEIIKGENDIEIDNKVYDTKSASPWAYDNKWNDGWHGVYKDDNFGYTAQLLGYSYGLNKNPGGWIVVNKSTGEVRVVEFDMPSSQVEKIMASVAETVRTVTHDKPFKRCFEPHDEYFRGKLTGSKRLPSSCTFCPYIKSCWPEAELCPQTNSKAKTPKYYWYTVYNEAKNEEE